MKPVRCVIVGCGGIGSWLAAGLVRALQFQAPMSQLVLVDGDNFEPKNVERQTFTTYGNKATALRSDLQPIAPQTFIVSMPAWIVPEGMNHSDEDGATKVTAHQVLKENDYVFVAVDNFAARKLIFDAARDYENIDIFTGGNDDRLFGSVYHYQRRDGIDVTLPPSHFHDEFVNPPDKNPGELSCQDRAALDGGTQLLAVNMGVAAWLLSKASYVIFGNDEEKQTSIELSEIYFDMEAGLSQPYDRRPQQVTTTV